MALVGTRAVELRFSVSGWASQRVEIPENITNGELEKMLESGQAFTSISDGDFEIYEGEEWAKPIFVSKPEELRWEIELDAFEVEAT